MSDHDINDPDHHPYHCPACPEFGLPCPDCPVHPEPMIADVPVPFEGTHDERTANFNSHRWYADVGDVTCLDCDAKVWHAAADYPCGTVPPRKVVVL